MDDAGMLEKESDWMTGEWNRPAEKHQDLPLQL